MKFLSTLAIISLAASAATALHCKPVEDGVKFHIIHYNPPEFTSDQQIDVTYYGSVLRPIDRDVFLRTYFYDKNKQRIHRGSVNLCAVIEKYHQGECPLDPEDGFKITVGHKFTTTAEDYIFVETEVIDDEGNCLSDSEDRVEMAWPSS
ncbi:hypothetical protein BG015_011686 [Linnemannia schmuckeri]|uniref:MD-2-related lipid-recognition domain-containing protein n=1 Tax=Linnemannia schmuckeri TaxID=64567 RepID=A0A9P5RS84_9FUNG|nr:hypothetical protein BG015_011686 [Linnemannia schmuckeri]